jgi:DNA polymerase-3 subunit epsilon
MKLKLNKPLIVFDLETTGVNVIHDRIVEIAYIKVWPDGHEENRTLRINPGRPIPEESTRVHGITNDDVKDCPTFQEVAHELFQIFKGCDLAGFNSNRFDIPMLIEEMARAGLDLDIRDVRCIDVQNIFHRMEQRSLIAAYKFYCDKDLENAHSALADTTATYEVLQSQLDRYADTLENDVDQLAEFSRLNRNVDLAGSMVYNDKDEIVFNFGKYKGQPVTDVLHRDPGYFSWIMQGDFTQETKNVLTRIRLQEKTKKWY